MQIFIILALLIAVAAAILAIQNVTVVAVTFLFWNIHSSLTLLLIIALLAGFLIGLLAFLPGSVRNKMSSSGQKKRLTALEAERNTYKQKSEESEKTVKELEEQLASFSAALEKYQSTNTLPKE